MSLYFPLIDPLRGFAAISVLIYHVIETCQWKDFPTSWGLVWFKWGWMGVDIFFIISGFVITHSALNIFARGERWQSTREFLMRRVRRIIPLYYLAIVFFLILTPEVLVRADFFKDLVAHLLFIHNWYGEFHRSIDAPSWTLGAEFQFYVVLILLLPYVNRKKLPWIILSSFIVTFLWRAFSFYHNFDGTPESADAIFVSATQLPGMIEFFIFGMVAAYAVRSEFFARVRKNWKFRYNLLAIIALLGYAGMSTFMAYEKDFWQTAHAVVFPRTLLALWFAALVLFLATFELGPKWRKILAPFIYLGTISYGIYLFHWPLLMKIKEIHCSPILKLLLTLLLTIALASLSWHFYEKRFLKRD